MAVRSNVAIWEHRRGQTNCFIGYQEHVLIAGESHWQIKRKIIHLLNCDAPQGSVSFIL
jgi:3-phenylpropionate/cinnamic acid dioxygenase small subunit